MSQGKNESHCSGFLEVRMRVLCPFVGNHTRAQGLISQRIKRAEHTRTKKSNFSQLVWITKTNLTKTKSCWTQRGCQSEVLLYTAKTLGTRRQEMVAKLPLAVQSVMPTAE